MNFSRPLAAVVLTLCCTLASVTSVEAAKAKSKPAAEPVAAYKGAVVIDATSGQVLFEDHDGESSPPASMTKLMTFLVLHDKLRAGSLTLQTPVTVNAADSRIGGTQVWLKEGEVFPVEELLYAMMIQSANDASYALARTSAGSVPAFVELMNAKARELGMTHTTFRTPHGLPPSSRRIAEGDLTTPHDFALLCRELLLKTDVLTYSSVKTRKFGEGKRTPDKVIAMINHNHLLGKFSIDGLKTGFTNGAGFCLSATAQRNGRRIIVVVMGSPNSGARDRKVAELVEKGFAALPPGSPPFPNAAPGAQPAAVKAEASPLSLAETPAEEPMIKFTVPKIKK